MFFPCHIIHLSNNKCQITTFVLSYQNPIAFASCFFLCIHSFHYAIFSCLSLPNWNPLVYTFEWSVTEIQYIQHQYFNRKNVKVVLNFVYVFPLVVTNITLTFHCPKNKLQACFFLTAELLIFTCSSVI